MPAASPTNRLFPQPTSPPPLTVTVLPLGNNLLSAAVPHALRRRRTLGHFSALSDANLVALLEALVSTLSPRSAATLLSTLAHTSSTLHAFVSDDDLWRRIAFSLFSTSTLARAPFAHSWRATVLRLLRTSSSITPTTFPPPSPPSIHSDILFHKRRCQTAPIDPLWLRYDDVPRLSAETLTAATFQANFESLRKPLILTHLATSWPAYKHWDVSHLTSLCNDTVFNAGGHDFTLSDYIQYASAIVAADDQPLYIFDPAFVDKVPNLAAMYTPPSHFGRDLFDVLASRRPNFRWLIIGPPRSGSSFHVDPNATSAWNAAIRGRKKWLLFPPGPPPPGVHPSHDGAHVSTPVSVLEWFINFYDRDVIRKAGAVECVVNPGEIMFIPRGWWHCVLNVDFSVAITQNYCSEVGVEAVVRWLRDKPQQISGCRISKDAEFMAHNFARLVAEECPHLRHKLRFALKPDNGEEETTDVPPSSDQNVGLWRRLQSTTVDRVPEGGNAQKSKTSTPFSFAF